MAGLLISFEGAERAGKSTQIRLLAERLQAEGWPVKIFREPGHTPLGEALRDLLLHRSFDIVSTEAEALLFSAARAELVVRSILPALAADHVVLCDRFFDSTLAYQGYGGGLSLLWLEEVQAGFLRGLEPALTFWLDLPPKEAALRGGGPTDHIERRAPDFHRRVYEGFRQLASRHPERIRRVDATQTPERIAELIWGEVRSALRQSRERGRQE